LIRKGSIKEEEPELSMECDLREADSEFIDSELLK
jgi:hypothetical protein